MSLRGADSEREPAKRADNLDFCRAHVVPTSIDCIEPTLSVDSEFGQGQSACDRVTGYHSSIVYKIPKNAADMSFDSVIEDLWQRHLQTLDPTVAARRFRRDWYYRAWFSALDMMDILDGKIGTAGDVCVCRRLPGRGALFSR